jgi:penicillin-binding protein 2
MGETNRKNVLTIVIISLFFILSVRLFYLQIYQWDRYLKKSEKNRIREITLTPNRGLIFDRNGEILVENRPSFAVSVVPHEIAKQKDLLSKLGKVLDEDVDDLKHRIRRNRTGNFAPVRIKRDINYKTLCYLQEYQLDFPGVVHSVEAKRFYPAGIRGSHIFGYCSEISRSELKRLGDRGYRSSDIIGKKGLEKQYEHLLRGRTGIKYVEVDALGREVRDLYGLGEKPALPGNNLVTTLDAELQRLAESIIRDKNAVVIMLDTHTGGVLTLASKPDYDPAVSSAVLDKKTWMDLTSDPNKPLYARATQSVYPPGSTYKLVLAAAAVENKIINEQYTEFCPGFAKLGVRTFHCWKRSGHENVNLIEAIKQSCNVYFYKLSLKVGLDLWADFGRKFGFGKVTGIDLPVESAGLLPDRTYLNAHYGVRRWTKGMLFNLAVGQGDLLVTPLQLAQFAMILANKGAYFKPHLLRCYVNPVKNDSTWIEYHGLHTNGISDETYNILRRGMWEVINGSHGTGIGARLRNVQVSGKTGTAQNPHGDDHAWFIGFAPFEEPEVAICVFVENGGSGGHIAAPIARKMLKRYFELYKAAPIFNINAVAEARHAQ